MVLGGMLVHHELTNVRECGYGYSAQWKNLRFIVSVSTEQDGRRWLHASVSRDGGGLPSYADIRQLKRLCIGEEKTALQVFPPGAKHIDIGSRYGVEVLHLWTCLDGDVTPDFTRGGETI